MRVSAFGGAAAAVIALGMIGAGTQAITVTVNEGTMYQTIEGIGPMEGAGAWTYKQGASEILVGAPNRLCFKLR